STSITEKRDWEHPPETAPSVQREDNPAIAQTVGLFGGTLVVVALIGLVVNVLGWFSVNTTWVTFLLALGLAGMLFHAAFDPSLEVRRLYWIVGLGLIGAGALVMVIPFRGAVGGLFLLGFVTAWIGLFFELAFLRHETDQGVHDLTLALLRGIGA